MQIHQLDILRLPTDPVTEAAVRLYAAEIEEQDPSDPEALGEVMEILSEGQTYVFADDNDGEFLAVANITIDDGVASLEGIAVNPSKRDQGVGSAVMRTLFGIAADQGCERMILITEAVGTSEGDKLRPFYQRLGFIVSSGVDISGHMERDLKWLPLE